MGVDPLRLRALDGLHADVAGRPVSIGRRQERTLLALVAMARPTALDGERLVERPWPDDAPAMASKVVLVERGRLRAALDAEDDPLVALHRRRRALAIGREDGLEDLPATADRLVERHSHATEARLERPDDPGGPKWSLRRTASAPGAS